MSTWMKFFILEFCQSLSLLPHCDSSSLTVPTQTCSLKKGSDLKNCLSILSIGAVWPTLLDHDHFYSWSNNCSFSCLHCSPCGWLRLRQNYPTFWQLKVRHVLPWCRRSVGGKASDPLPTWKLEYILLLPGFCAAFSMTTVLTWPGPEQLRTTVCNNFISGNAEYLESMLEPIAVSELWTTLRFCWLELIRKYNLQHIMVNITYSVLDQ